MGILNIVILVLLVLMIFLSQNICFAFFQESSYHLTYYLKLLKKYYLSDWAIILLIVFFILLFYLNLYTQICLLVLLCIYSIKEYNSFKSKIVKYKYTKRIIRLNIFTFIVCFICCLIFRNNFQKVFLIFGLLMPFISLISLVALLPIERLINLYFKKKAYDKLTRCSPIIIAITGSYGKTSTKNILYEMLKKKYIVYKTEKSYNTVNGIAKSINNNLNITSEIAIFEVGISHVGDMKKIMGLVKPDYVIITDIGPQHLKTMKTIENIVNEKMSILNYLKDNGVAIINSDSKYIQSYVIKQNINKIKVGIGKWADYRAKNISYNENGLNFSIESNKEKLNVKTKLLGRHNIYNIMFSTVVSLELGLSKTQIEEVITSLKPINNRLEVKIEGDLTILNDGYNSNEVGFMNALEVLSFYKKYRILITPGIVEGGESAEEINSKVAIYSMDVCDEVYLCDSVSTDYFVKIYKERGFEKYKIMNNFKEAFDIVLNMNKERVVLIENDITDIYKK